MITAVFLTLFVVISFALGYGAFKTLCNSVRYRDVMVGLDADRIAHQPFQPPITILVRCDLKRTQDPVRKIQDLLSLNYTRYNVILGIDAARDPEAFAEILSFFEMRSVAKPDSLAEFPVGTCYRSASSLFKRLRVFEKTFHPFDDFRSLGNAVVKEGYVLFVRSLDHELIGSSLANLAIMKMRSSQGHVAIIRGVARYDCSGTFSDSIFRTTADLCNLRRIYITGSLCGGDYGQFVELWDPSRPKGRLEVVPKPQMFLHPPENFRTYLDQLLPPSVYMSRRGKVVSGMECLLGVMFWWGVIHLIAGQESFGTDFLFMPGAFLMAVIASTFGIFVGEIFLKKNYRFGYVFRMLPISFVEALLFCILQPWVWVIYFFSRHVRPKRNVEALRARKAPR